MMRRISVAIGLSFLLAGAAEGGDWPFWRGPEQTGMSRENAVVTSWTPGGENMVWRSDVAGRSTPVIMNGRVFLQGPVGEGECSQERVACLDANTGKLLWEYRFNVFLTDMVENRVGWTSVVGDPETGNVYAHGTGGEMLCLSRDGKLLWKRSMTEEFGRISGYGGRLQNPIIDEDRVIVGYMNSSWGPMGKPTHRYVAFDKRTGVVQWWAEPGGVPLDTTYSCPVIAIVDGVRMLIDGNSDGCIYGIKARTGEALWSYKLSKRGINSSCVVDGKYVYVGHSEENLHTTEMGAILCIDATKRGDITENGAVWRHDGYGIGYASPAVANGRLYCVDNSATMFCFDAKDGRLIWEYDLGRVGKGSPVVTADGVIYVGEQTGVFHILKDAGERCEQLDRDEFTGPGGLVDEIFGSPAVVNGAVYFVTRYNFFCLGPTEVCVTAAKVDPMQPQPTGEVSEVTVAMIEPAEITLRPGESVQFGVRLYDVNQNRTELLTQSSGDVELNWGVKGPYGEISQSGMFTAMESDRFTAGSVVCLVGDKQAVARVRICPNDPIREDFDSYTDGQAVPGWIGLGKKAVVAELEGNKVLKKIADKANPSPPFMRMDAYATPPLPVGYTVQADMRSELKDTRRRAYQSDMGLINGRYYLFVIGGDPKGGEPGTLRIETWGAVPRLRKEMEFKWDSDKWYTAKFDVRLVDGKAQCRGKFWPRDESEPADWQIEVTDPCPNLEGSAGLFAYSTFTTAGSDGPMCYFDNFQVMANEN